MGLAAVTVAGLLTAAGTSGAAAAAAPWPLARFGVDQAWTVSTGAGVTVAVVDGGVDARHPSLRGRVLAGLDVANRNSDATSDPRGHGTAVASVVAGAGDPRVCGIAPAAQILPVAVTGAGSGTAADAARGIRAAVERGVRIINVSLTIPLPLAEVRAAVDFAVASNVVVVAAAGNNGTTGNAPQYPAAIPGVVAVTATDGTDAIAPSSTTGPQVVLAAPGTGVPVALAGADGYGTSNGSSVAAAYVSGVAALVWSRFPDWTAGQVIRRLIGTARSSALPTQDRGYGYGLVDPLLAVTTPGAPTEQSNPLLDSAVPPSSTAARPSSTTPGPTAGPGPGAPPDDPAALAEFYRLPSPQVLRWYGGLIAAAAGFLLAVSLARSPSRRERWSRR